MHHLTGVVDARQYVIKLAREQILPSTACIFAPPASGVCSGVFVARKGVHFLVTARHNVEDIDSIEAMRRVRVGSVGLPGGVSLEGVTRVVAHEEADVAVMVLPDGTAEALRPRWINDERLQKHLPPEGADLLVNGFPHRLRRHEVHHFAQITRFGLLSYLGPVDGVDERGRILVAYDEDELVSLPSNEPLRDAINPEGMSGGGVYCLAEESKGVLSVPLTLCGIQSSIGVKDRKLRIEPASVVRSLIEEALE